MSAFRLWKDTPEKVFKAPFDAGSVAVEISPELLGVGYIIGPAIAGLMAGGGVLAYLVLIPMIKYFGAGLAGPLAPGTKLISAMSPGDVRGAYVLYIGAGAVAAAGIISLFRSLPVIWSDSAKFAEAADRLQNEASKLYAVSRSGDEAAVKAQMGAVGKACGGCHESFRQKQ